MRGIAILIFSLLFKFISAQNAAEATFRSPLDVPLIVTAGFGEIRPDHFHSGTDFSTYGKNQPVKAAGSGYVSRIKISEFGYGNALYINHPNGLTTVYAHLSKFNEALGSYASRIQESGREYEIDILTDSTEFRVMKGDLIGYSGNSGSSSAPHLHFEVRDQAFQNTLNPLLFGFPANDFTAPDIRSVSILPLRNYGRVNNVAEDVHLPLMVNKKTRKKSISPKTKIPLVSGWVGFGFQGGDVIGKTRNLSGIYQVRLEVDSQLIFDARFDEFSFDETRCVNAYMNYPAKKKSGRKIQQCIVPANNMIGIYKSHLNRGYFYFDQHRLYDIKYTLTDVSGNKTVFSLKVKGSPPNWNISVETPDEQRPEVIPGSARTLSIDGFEATFDPESLFDTSKIKLSSRPVAHSYSNVYELGSIYIPVNQAIQVRILAGLMPDSLKSKLLIVRRQGNSQDALPTNWDDDWLEAPTKEFGDFLVVADTTAPVISYVSAKTKYKVVKKGKSKVKVPVTPPGPSKPEGTIHFRIYDSLSGIASMQAYLNNNWILLEPGAGKNEWQYSFAEDLPAGVYNLKIQATDRGGNARNFELGMEKPQPAPESPSNP